MQLFHFTSAAHLHGIRQHGLTVGDVVTDLQSFRGKVGVWLTSSEIADGHGLRGSGVDKTEYRLRVDVANNQLLWKWTEWAKSHISLDTKLALDAADGFNSDKFFIYFGWLAPDRIVEVLSMKTGEAVADWGYETPERALVPGVPFSKRHAWHRRTMQNVRNALVAMAAEQSRLSHWAAEQSGLRH